MFTPASRQMSIRRLASFASLAPQALKNSLPPPKVPVPSVSAGTRNPELPSCRYSMNLRSGKEACLLSHVLGGRAVAVGRPARRAEQVASDVARVSRFAQIAEDLDPVEECDLDRVVGAQRCDQSIAAGQVIALRDVSAE